MYGDPYQHDETVQIADFTIVGGTDQDMEITGTLGVDPMAVEIDMSEFDSPLEIFSLFYEAHLYYDCLVQY